MWTVIETMLTNYDAQGIAEVLGLAVVRSVRRHRASTGISRDSRKRLEVPVVPPRHHDPLVGDASGASPTTAAKRSGVDEGSSATSVTSLERAVENGLPRSALRHVATRLAGGDQTKITALEWGVVPKTTLERRDLKLSVPESERTERIARLFVHARRALGTEAEAREFITTAHPELGGRSPFQAGKTDLGARQVERILAALEYGLAL